MESTPELQVIVDRWTTAWVHLKKFDLVAEGRAVKIHTRLPSREWEYLIAEPAPAELDALIHAVGDDPRKAFTVVTRQPETYLALAIEPTLDRDDEMLMTRELTRMDASMPDGIELKWNEDGKRVNVLLISGDQLAASGHAGVVGTDAVFDRIETMPAFRRRGLGTLVMGFLESWAYVRGARTGILAASDQGQPLYAALGWTPVANMLMWRGARP